MHVDVQMAALEALHRCDYKMLDSLNSFLPPNGPALCRDQMEEWSVSEANLFEEALERYNKDFSEIRNDFVRSSCFTRLLFCLLFFAYFSKC